MSETLTVEVVKKDHTAFKATDGNWYNADKKAKPNFESLQRGMTLGNIDRNENWIKKFEIVGEQALPAVRSSYEKVNSPEKDAMIARHKAVEVVLLSPSMHDTTQSVEERLGYAKELILEVERYILTGKF